MSKLRRRALIGGGLGAIGLGLSPAGFLGTVAYRESGTEQALPEGFVDDASHLERAAVADVTSIGGSTEEVIVLVESALALARDRGWPISIAGARHTMGGHTIAPGGMTLDLGGARSMRLEGELLRVGAGARWSDVIAFLEPHGRAVKVMQSNADFAVGGSLGANCHGWQPGHAPLVSTVRELVVVDASGRTLRASRDENRELFAHVVGGYGLFGIVVEVVLETTENVLCESEHRAVPLDDVAALVTGASGDAELAFARLCIAGGQTRFEEALVTVYRRVEGTPPPLAPVPTDDLARLVFRGEIDSDFGKHLRWLAESQLGSEGGERTSRNQLMSEPVARFANRRPDRTDVLFEAFVPPDAAPSWTREMRDLVAAGGVELLNVTMRHVREDHDTVLRYATGERVGLVLLFTHGRGRSGDEAMASLSRALVDVTLDHGGRYYLPYRGHATREQLVRAYPEWDGLLETKARLDPDLMFQNRFWQRYR